MTATRGLDTELDELLSESDAAVREREATTFDRALAACNHRIVLLGAGNLGRRVADRLGRDGIRPLAFVDNSSAQWGSSVAGIPLLSPSEAARQFGVDTLFVVTIWNNHHRYVDSQRQLAGLGCRHILPVTSFRWKYHEQFLPFFWEERPSVAFADRDGVRRGFELWDDDFSRAEYVAQVRWRLRGDFAPLAAPVAAESYFPADLFALEAAERFVDCGAFDGCTIESYLKHSGGKFAAILGLEPDPGNFGRLQDYHGKLPADVRARVQVLPFAVGAERGLLRFDARGDMGSTFSATGGTEVEVRPLDELCAGSPPTYIKMDIEGAEAEALRGTRRLIGASAPLLSVCLYHKPADLWQLPMLIKQLHGDYRLFLRPHEYDGWQLVCYAVPPQRVRGGAMVAGTGPLK